MKRKAFNKAVKRAAMEVVRKKLLLFAACSATIAVGVMGLATNKLLDSISTDEDWSDVDWALDEEDIEEDAELL